MEHAELLAAAVPLLTEWYKTVKKDLPWRRNPTPYRVWISEIMLQQTRIEAAIPYYERFLARLPDVPSLAGVPGDELMKLWEGLGYYSRARNLKKAAAVVMERYGGVLPETAGELRQLPGIGDYTAGAIASIACGRPEPAVDGNVLRVLARLTEWSSDVLAQKTRRQAAEALREVYPSGRSAGLLTEGLMELGETVCLPNGSPHCEECPLADICLACRSGTAERYPVRRAARQRRQEQITVLLLEKDGRFALCRRPEEGLLAGMWQFPNEPGRLEGSEVRKAAERLGLETRDVTPAGTGHHVFSHVEWHMTGWHVACRGGEPDGSLIWFTPEQIQTEVALPAAFRCWREKVTGKRAGKNR